MQFLLVRSTTASDKDGPKHSTVEDGSTACSEESGHLTSTASDGSRPFTVFICGLSSTPEGSEK